MSVISMLVSPNDESPANIDAAVRVSKTMYTIIFTPLSFLFR